MHLDERMPATREPPSRANGRARSVPRCSGATAGESIKKLPKGFGAVTDRHQDQPLCNFNTANNPVTKAPRLQIK